MVDPTLSQSQVGMTTGDALTMTVTNETLRTTLGTKNEEVGWVRSSESFTAEAVQGVVVTPLRAAVLKAAPGRPPGTWGTPGCPDP